jgi:DNA-binding NtrC family response regulator/tetratricopeptide (TPR) repeat protein
MGPTTRWPEELPRLLLPPVGEMIVTAPCWSARLNRDPRTMPRVRVGTTVTGPGPPPFPQQVDEGWHSVVRHWQFRRGGNEPVDPLDQVSGTSPPIVALRARARQLLEATRQARRPPAVLLLGEVGTGKNLLAHALHQASGRAAGPFVHVQCNAIPESLAESLLFGHERGAFTGADRARVGYFRAAQRGTILLDEIGTLSEVVQSRLLQVIDEGLVPVIGLSLPVPIDVWVICATNVDLDEAARSRQFRADLLSRLTIRFTLPPLRQRRSDIVPLADQFLTAACAEFGEIKKLSPAAYPLLEHHPWPENARELRKVITNAVIFTKGPVIGVEHLDLGLPTKGEDHRERYLDVLEQTGWNISRAAKLLGVSRPTLRARILRWKLREPPALREGGDPSPTALRAPGSPEPDLIDAVRSALDESGAAARPPSRLDAARAGPADAREIRWERRWLGLLRFTLTGPDADDAMVSARPYVDMAVEKVEQFGGDVVDLWPTGLDAAFGLDGGEGAAQRAGSAALAIRLAATRADQDASQTLEWRIALHAMSCLVGLQGSTPRIDRDARRRADDVMEGLLSSGEHGGVLASGEMAPFLRRRFSLGAPLGLGRTGRARPLLGALLRRGGFGEFPGTFVGRRAEIETLEACGAMARQGRGQIVGIVGDPGVGKSRLLWEFLHGDFDHGWLVLEAASPTPGRPTPLFAVIEMLRLYFDVSPGEAKETVRDKIARRLALVDEALTRSLPAFLALFDVPVEDTGWQMLEPSVRRRQMLVGIKRLMLRESARQPLVLVFEDAHWVDSETRELLDEIAESVPVAHVLMLVTYRPEHQHGWTGWSFYTHLRVEPLRGESADLLVDELLGADASLAKLRPLLIQWTDGNPFFIEEVVRTLVETGALQGERGAYRLVRAVAGIVVPGTVEEVLASRISRLGSGPAEVLRAAAVLGRRVPYAVLAAVSPDRPEALDSHLHVLQGGEFVYQAGESEEREYIFRHALTQEVAYASLTDDRRRRLHSRAMEAMLAVYADCEDEKINELAHHALEGRVWDRAAGYLRRAGRRAFARSANRQAVECFTRALSALSHLPLTRASQEEAIDLRFDLRSALWPLGEVDTMGKVLAEAGDLARTLNDQRRQGLVAVARCHYFFIMSQHADAVSAGEEALALARATGNNAIERDATLYMGIVHGAMGSYGRAVELLRANLAAYEVADEKLSARERVVGRPTARTYVARYLAELGELGQASDHANAGMKAAETGANPWLLATCYFGMGSVELRRGNFPAAISSLERAVELCRSHHLQSWFPATSASLGYAYANAGRASEGLALLEQAVAHADRMHVSASYSMWLTYLGHALLCLGRAAEAQVTAETALERARKHGERGHEAWALFLFGSAAARVGSSDADTIEQMLGQAIDLARSLGMRPLLAYCQAGLAEAADRLGRPERAAAAREAAEQIRKEIGMISPARPL